MANVIKQISVADVPEEALDAVRPHAVRNGYNKNNASVLRFSLVDTAKRYASGDTLGNPVHKAKKKKSRKVKK